MPPRPFIFSRETERAAIDRVFHEPAKKQILYEMIDAVIRVNQTRCVTPSDLAPILAGFEFTDEGVWSRAAGWLAKLHAFDPRITANLHDLSRNPSAIVRLNLFRSLDRFPKGAVLPLLRNFINDRSSRVRQAVLGVAMIQNYPELLPALQTRRNGQISAAERRSLDEAI